MWRGGWHGHVEWGGVRIGEDNGGVGSRWWGGGLEGEQDCMPGNDRVADGLGLVCPCLWIDTPPFSLI